MNWWFIITAVIAAALAYGYWDHTKQSRYLAACFARLAGTYGGEVTRATLLALPQLRFEMDGRRFLVTAMATSGEVSAGGSGHSGPFTFVNVDLPFASGLDIRAERTAPGVDRLIGAIIPARHPITGHKDFDEAFLIHGGDQALAVSLFDGHLREKLLHSRLAHLDLRVTAEKISVHMDGFAQSMAELEELIDIASVVARAIGRTPWMIGRPWLLRPGFMGPIEARMAWMARITWRGA